MLSTRLWHGGLIANLTQVEDRAKLGSVHLPGLPNNPFPIPGITDYLGAKGWILQPHYEGSYDSEGQFEPDKSHTAIVKWLSAAGKAVKNLQSGEDIILPHWHLLSGHSFGTFPLLKILLAGRSPVGRAVLFAPTFAFGATARDAGVRIDFDAQARYIRTAFSHTFRTPAADTLSSFFRSGAFGNVEEEVGEAVAPVKCFFVFGANDPMVDADVAPAFVERFCDKYSRYVEFVGSTVVEGGGHEIASLLDSPTRKLLDNFLDWSAV